MHPIIQRLIESRKATGWPSKRGIHASDQAYDTADWHKAQFGRWTQCGFQWVKLMAADDSQVNTIIEANKVHFKPMWVIRLYGNNAPDDFIDPKTVKKYVDRGVQFFESTANEFYAPYENKWGNVGMPADWPRQIAAQYAKQANAIRSVGGVPITPAVETWHMDMFTRLIDELAAHHRDTLMNSVIGMHNRTLNHPVSWDKDSSGYRGWEDFDDYVKKVVGEPLPMIATEAGPEPLWDMDKTMAPVSVDMHAAWVRELLDWTTPDYYLADCLWEWKGRGPFYRASYIENTLLGGRDLPVVNVLQEWRPETVQPSLSLNYIQAVTKARPSQISLWPGAALYKAGQYAQLGQAETSEWTEGGWHFQKFERGGAACKAGDWGNVKVVRWSDVYPVTEDE